MKKIGLIGFGTIGRHLYEDLKNDAELAFVYARKRPEDADAARVWISTPEQLEAKCREGVDLVTECAVTKTVLTLAPIVLKYTDMLAFSITAFAEEGFQEQVGALCAEYHHTFYVPHGAILGLDGIFAGRRVLKSVTITTTKKPENLGRKDQARTVLYDGPTRGACRAYPRNVNVHAAVALAGLGFDRTRSRIVADPAALGNTHRIEIDAEGCHFAIDVLSTPVSGVTGAYTPISAASSVRRVLFRDGIVIA